MCTGTTEAGLQVECREGDFAWPFEFEPANLVPGRNFFVRTKAPPFFSAARAEGRGGTSWVFAGVDGRAHLCDGTLEETGTFLGWGSDITGIKNPCGSGVHVLAVLPGETPGKGSIQAFEIVNSQPAAVSPPLGLSGAVTAFWPSQSGDTVVAVTRNSETGNHAAFHLFVACSR
jgi:hypothetical protein